MRHSAECVPTPVATAGPRLLRHAGGARRTGHGLLQFSDGSVRVHDRRRRLEFYDLACARSCVELFDLMRSTGLKPNTRSMVLATAALDRLQAEEGAVRQARNVQPMAQARRARRGRGAHATAARAACCARQ